MSICSRLFPNFSSVSFNLSGIMLQYLIHLELTFVQCDKHISICRPQVTPAPFVENAFSFPPYGYGFFVKDYVTIGMCVYYWTIDSIPLIYLSVSVSLLGCFLLLLLCSRAWGQGYWFSKIFFFSCWKLSLPFWVLCFHMKLRITLSMSVKNCVDILMRISLIETVYCFW